jgi:hypothetical protein
MASDVKADWERRLTPDNDSDNEAAKPDDLKDPQEIFDFKPDGPLSRHQTFSSVAGDEKRSRDFGNAKDGDELGKLMGADGEKLLAVVDEIRKIDALQQIPIDIPQVYSHSTFMIRDEANSMT